MKVLYKDRCYLVPEKFLRCCICALEEVAIAAFTSKYRGTLLRRGEAEGVKFEVSQTENYDILITFVP